MSWRARAYLMAAALRCLLLGTLCAFTPETFLRQPSVALLNASVPLEVWGVILTLTGYALVAAVVFEREEVGRWALVVAATVTGVWLGVFIVGVVQEVALSPLLAISWGSLVLKDFIIASQPTQTPFADIARAVDSYNVS